MTHVDLGGAAGAGGSKTLRGYLATPAGESPFPAVVMIHEAFGLNDQIRRHADRLAAAGYLTLAVDLFSDGGPRRCLMGTMKSMVTGKGRVFADIAAARSWLQASPLSTGRTGVIGFCMGGGFALLAANDGFDAASVNYGRLPRDLEPALRAPAPSSRTTARRTAPCAVPRQGWNPPWMQWASNTTSRSSRRRGTPS
ncbi:dienelactone hydrolase [Arthrobacter globiformis]|nr:dienelactone hydrolase [Arthrobacter globiformis]